MPVFSCHWFSFAIEIEKTAWPLQPVESISVACLHTIIKSQTPTNAEWEHKQTGAQCAVNQDMWTQPANTKLSYHAWYLPSLFCTLFCLERLKKVREGRRRGRDGDRYWCAATALIKRYGSWALLSARLFRRLKTHASSKDVWERNANLSRIRFPVEGIGEAWTYRNVQTNTYIRFLNSVNGSWMSQA